MAYPRTLFVLKPGIRDGEPAPSLHKVPVHSDSDVVQALAPCGGLDVSGAFIEPARFGREASELACDLSSREGAQAALSLLADKARAGKPDRATALKIAAIMGIDLDN